jgi:hypothetical protein
VSYIEVIDKQFLKSNKGGNLAAVTANPGASWADKIEAVEQDMYAGQVSPEHCAVMQQRFAEAAVRAGDLEKKKDGSFAKVQVLNDDGGDVFGKSFSSRIRAEGRRDGDALRE